MVPRRVPNKILSPALSLKITKFSQNNIEVRSGIQAVGWIWFDNHLRFFLAKTWKPLKPPWLYMSDIMGPSQTWPADLFLGQGQLIPCMAERPMCFEKLRQKKKWENYFFLFSTDRLDSHKSAMQGINRPWPYDVGFFISYQIIQAASSSIFTQSL